MGEVHSAPRPLPTTTSDLMAQRKGNAKRTLNDMVEELHLGLFEDEKYRGYLWATYDEQAKEGSLSADNVMAAMMLRERAKKMDSPVALEKLATISKALGVVLKRYGETRKERRNTVGGEYVRTAEDNGE
jgi:hypothetical protein